MAAVSSWISEVGTGAMLSLPILGTDEVSDSLEETSYSERSVSKTISEGSLTLFRRLPVVMSVAKG